MPVTSGANGLRLADRSTTSAGSSPNDRAIAAPSPPCSPAPNMRSTYRRCQIGRCKDGLMPRQSIILVNTGHGKGKSSAAFGVMSRGWARGWTVGVVQFLKSGRWKIGEKKLADHLGI